MAVCDRCSTEVEAGGGYMVYSEASMIPGQDFGSLLICESCANELFTEEVWSEAKHIAVEVDPSMDFKAKKRALRQVNDFAIAMLAKRRGLNTAQARQEAREIVQIWWKDQQAAERKLRSQLSAPTVDAKPTTRDGVDAPKESPLTVLVSYLLIILMLGLVVAGCIWIVSLFN